MRKKIVYSFFMAAIVITTLFIAGCSSAKAIQNPVIGIIEIVGNEPFTRLAVNINDKDVYLLECSKEIQSELLKNQQRVYQIIYSEVKQTDEGIILVVSKAIPIKTK